MVHRESAGRGDPLLGDLAVGDAHPQGGGPVVVAPPPHHHVVAGDGGLHRPHVAQQAAGGQPAVHPTASHVTVVGVDDGVRAPRTTRPSPRRSSNHCRTPSGIT